MITLEEYEKMSKDERRIYFLSINEDEELKNMDSWDRMLYYRMKEGLSPELIRKNMQDDYERTITPPIEFLWQYNKI
jgi:hypothetical protein